MDTITRHTRLALAAALAAALPFAASAMSTGPAPDAPAPLVLASFGPEIGAEAPLRPHDEAVQIASLHANTPWAVRVVPAPVETAVSVRAAKRAKVDMVWIGLTVLSGLVMALSVHQRIAQARASGPRPTAEA